MKSHVDKERVKVVRTAGGFRAELPSRKSWFHTFQIGVGLLSLVPGTPLLIGTLPDANGDNTLILIAFLLFMAFGTFNLVLLFFWTIEGKETVTYADGVITIERHLPSWTRTQSFEVGPELRLRVVPRAPRMWFQSEPFDWLLFLGSWRRGSLQFAYKRAYRGFGVDLNETEAELLMSQLRAS